MDDHEKFAARLRECADDPIKIRNLAGEIDSDSSMLPPWMRRGFKLRGLTAAERDLTSLPLEYKGLTGEIERLKAIIERKHGEFQMWQDNRRKLESVLEQEKNFVAELWKKNKLLENEIEKLTQSSKRKTWNRLGGHRRIHYVEVRPERLTIVPLEVSYLDQEILESTLQDLVNSKKAIRALDSKKRRDGA